MYQPEPLWYKDAIIYEAHVKTFYDSNNDGIGDFQGLRQKLGYLESLGITAIWLLPFYPSPLRDDGYDIADYMSVNPDYGTLEDFRQFLEEAHSRGMKVITELVVNHTSDQHAWFQRARKAPAGSPERNFYVWSDDMDKYSETRIIFQDFEASNWTWDPVAKQYFWHRFYHHQPDLNFENPEVHQALFDVLDFWLGMGVDGLRLDAVPYLYEAEGTNCENLPQTYDYLRKLRSYVDEHYPNRMLLAEANQWPEDSAAYLGEGDLCHMNFHFPLMPRMYMALATEDRFPILDILDQTPEIPENCQWASFLRNHDELTLEMVTDEERDYMRRVYANDPRARINLGIRRRLAPLMTNDRRRIELMNIMLLSLPGTPVLYYGDEIGMGDNYYLGDRDGVRTPMQWNSDRNAGFSRANPQKLLLPVIIDPEYHYEAVNVEVQESNTNSLLWWMRHAIATARRYKSLSRGSIEFLQVNNPKVLIFTRTFEDETMLAVINLSRNAQAVTIDLSGYEGCIPEEVFSLNRFPKVRETPYMVALGAYGFFWLRLVRENAQEGGRPYLDSPYAKVARWQSCFVGKSRERLETEILPKYFMGSRWFGGKARTIIRIAIIDTIPVEGLEHAKLLITEVSYSSGENERYQLPVCFTPEGVVSTAADNFSSRVIAKVVLGDEEGYLCDATYENSFLSRLFHLVMGNSEWKGKLGNVNGVKGEAFDGISRDKGTGPEPFLLGNEQSNTSIRYRDDLCLKLYRRIETGVSPEVEMCRALSERSSFAQLPNYLGTLDYVQSRTNRYSIGILQSFVPNEGDTWKLSLDYVQRYYEEVLSKLQCGIELPPLPALSGNPVPIPPAMQELIGGTWLGLVEKLAERTAEMHIALASMTDQPEFAPEPFTSLYQRSIYQAMCEQVKRSMILLREVKDFMIGEPKELVLQMLANQKKILQQFEPIRTGKIDTLKVRIHGDYHLGQVLSTGNDVVIIDFEGEPSRPISERKIKRSVFRDVAGMMRSFDYAAFNVLLQANPVIRQEDVARLEPWAERWSYYVGQHFVDSYFSAAKGHEIVPEEASQREHLLRGYLMNKAVYELNYELNNRPEWATIPMRGILKLIEL
ncbi:trehalose synthase [Chlorobium limicola DSM 245]|uniref:Maltokinase n=1 Tax=Chlorobium limicola (strain DSM 245 / NBRC 103803 / 6330) TaxID=290315 RepID=B3EHZ2_CHLL2|nr:maltose alpha-D-glucosyltransferase [Chlorobium limicola]ACD91401.1 trehalose synthase [Chlorobium limicola DSM 245]